MRITPKTLDIAEAKKHLSYDPVSGNFYRLLTFRSVKFGDVAGARIESTTKPGKYYIRIGVLGKYVWAHRLAWAYMTGSWPQGEIDHINQNSEDNSWANLREVRTTQNMKNLCRYKTNTTGYPGISIRESGRYRVRISDKGKSINLGTYKELSEAVAVWNEGKKRYGYHENYCM